MKKLIYIFALLAIGSSAAFAQTVTPATTTTKPTVTPATTTTKPTVTPATTMTKPTETREKFDPKRVAADDLQTAIARATRENKRIILDVGGEWCVWCREMDNFLIRNAELSRLRAENFVWLKINFSEENENKAFLAAYPEIKGYPHLYVLEKDGKFLYSKDTSELEDGKKSYNLQKFTEFLNEYSSAKTAAIK